MKGDETPRRRRTPPEVIDHSAQSLSAIALVAAPVTVIALVKRRCRDCSNTLKLRSLNRQNCGCQTLNGVENTHFLPRVVWSAHLRNPTLSRVDRVERPTLTLRRRGDEGQEKSRSSLTVVVDVAMMHELRVTTFGGNRCGVQ